MPRSMFHLIVATVLLTTGCCKILNCKEPCPPIPEPTKCCSHSPHRPGHSSEELATGTSTPVTVANLRIVPEETYVDTTTTGSYILHAAVHIAPNGGNVCSDSLSGEAIISLPQYSIVEHIEAVSASGRELQFQQCKAQVKVKLSHLCPNNGKDKIEITVQRAPLGSPADCQPSFSVFVYSGIPENDPSDNFWWWRRHCGGGSDDLSPDDPTWGPDDGPIQPSKGGQ